MDVQACLADRRRYERQIERLHQRHLLSARLYELRQEEVSLASIVMQRAKVAKLLAREVAEGRYELEPGEMKPIRVKGKNREIFACRLTDLIVHGVVADVVAEAAAAALSPRVFSYRRGLSWAIPVSEFAAYLRAARHAGHGGVHVLRRDVDSYFDSIPLGAGSPLWPMLERHLGAPLPALVVESARVELYLEDGGLAGRLLGVPTGQPIGGVIGNLYLGELDRALESLPGGFYARYGDDYLFAHPDADVAREADARSDAILERLGLTVSERKRRTYYLTPCGRPSPDWPEVRGAPAVGFLGSRITADGTIGLDSPKARLLLRELDRRVAATARTMRGARRDEIGRAVCAVVNRSLEPGNTLTQHTAAQLLRTAVTDRRQLRDIDYRIARSVVRAVTGRSSVRAFRDVPYRTLRRDWGLVSLVEARNSPRRRR
jgi:hypothetical protein